MGSGTQSSYLIVGAGVFGVSTALHLIKKYPNASVTLVDRDAFDADSRVAASWDWNKVVRADYDDIVYCQMGLEAQDIFESDPLWMPFFHKTGIFWTCRDAYAQNVIDNYKKLGRKADLKAVPVAEARKMYGGLFDDADYSDVQEVLVNKTSGWGAAGDCLQAVTKEAIRVGVKYVTAEVATLELNSSGHCTGIKTSTGQILSATHTILSTGAFTAKLLELSAEQTGVSSLRADGRVVAGGIATGMATLDNETYKKFTDMPVGVQGYSTPLPFIGSLPPTKDRELKWWSQTIFTNTTQVLPGRSISAPPARPDYGQWDVPEKLRDGIKHASKVFYGSTGEGWKKEKHRICWDAFTSSGDFIISPHSGAQGLYVATCGNFHGWKFFPVLGAYVLQMLEGTLPSDLQTKFAWDRDRPDPKFFADYPRHEMNRVLESPGTAKL